MAMTLIVLPINLNNIGGRLVYPRLFLAFSNNGVGVIYFNHYHAEHMAAHTLLFVLEHPQSFPQIDRN